MKGARSNPRRPFSLHQLRLRRFGASMLDHIDTGYEGKFDFAPRVAGPERAYLLASLPRAGSTHFSHVLWRTGCLGALLEYLNFQPAGPYGFAAASADLQQQ